mmetsp:Transcript_33924/g.41030  ORF Transcript_33924/g.41030 Transcript_33924/m.41030 type:complete len:285 (-) Transcript_33924:338-1192(-)|eukprot:CAMPEP_0197851026 /NCGR_PEP_ID=MMETSP1438-20131217/17056_1 /TAXON_ID=1461541 /ORGANISM="Pterosperma sp., Strain CCMP1384" /LENGTH=284 /DNA_ID=CAMNT_0043464483 /DNA_START=113 /DNA_END=967 /DNA_ORIENTATION=+
MSVNMHCIQQLTTQVTSSSRSLNSTPIERLPTCNVKRAVKPSSRRFSHITCQQNTRPHSTVACQIDSSVARRNFLGLAAATVSATLFNSPEYAAASPGGLPGLAPPDAEGISKYTRPAGKSGNHGIGWAAIDSYSFKVPEGWEQVGSFDGEGYGGQEIDLRFENKSTGRLTVIVAPAGRFVNIDESSQRGDLNMNSIGSPEKVITAFAAEITNGGVLDKDDIVSVEVVNGKGQRPYYVYELKGHVLVSATTINDRVYILSIRSTSAQWRKGKGTNYAIRDSFSV